MFIVERKFELSCSHRLHNPELIAEENKKIYGKCYNVPSHGHNYSIKVSIRTNELINGMVINFTDIKKIFMEKVDKKFDHKFLNNEMGEITTAENLAKVIYNTLKEEIPNLYSVEVGETDNCSAIYIGD